MRIFCSFLLSCLPLISLASIDYLEQLDRISNGSVDRSTLQTWQGEILYPHLYEAWLSENIERITVGEANRFMNNPENRAAAWFFRDKWFNELVRRQAWTTLLSTFSDSEDPAQICHVFEAKVALNQAIPDQDIQSLWMSGRSRPDHCDPFLIRWIQSLPDPNPVVWERQLLAFYARNGKLVRYLNRFYTDDENTRLGEFLSQVYNQPKELIRQSYNPNSEQMRQIALAAVNRMAFQDARSASNLWQAVVKATPGMTSQDIQNASRWLGIAMAKQAIPEASYWLAIADPLRKDDEVQHWRLQMTLADKDYRRVIDMYEQLDPSLQQSDQWLYWVGVARLQTETFLAVDNPLTALSQRRLYYGFLAAGVLGRQPSLGTQTQYAANDLNTLQREPSMQRAKALFEAGQVVRAQVEWNLHVRVLDNPAQHAAAELAYSWGWYAKSSQSAGWSRRYDLLDLRYPNAFETTVSRFSSELALPQHWVYGVMRQESRYDHQAVSPAGALGLMQVMPATASQTAQKYGLPYQGTVDLHDPSINIAIGTHYLSELIQRFEHPVLATAAYNAGPSRVRLWRERFPNDMTIWIESIPFNETRNYVKSVLAFSQIYALMYDLDWHLASWTNPATAFAQSSD